MNKEQIDQLALEIYRGTDWEERLTVEQAVISLTTRFLARVDAERAKEQEPAAWAVLSEVEGFNFIAQWPEACHEHINDYYTQCLENVDEIEKCSVIALYTHPQPAPEGYKLVPDAFLKKLVDFFERSPTLSSTNYYETRNSLYSSAAAMLAEAPKEKP